MTDSTNNNEKKGNLPTHRAFFVTNDGKEDSKGNWKEIGALWPHKDGEGFSLKLDLIPTSTTNGRIEVRKIQPKPDATDE